MVLFACLFCLFLVLGIGPSALHILGAGSTSEPLRTPCFCYFRLKVDKCMQSHHQKYLLKDYDLGNMLMEYEMKNNVDL